MFAYFINTLNNWTSNCISLSLQRLKEQLHLIVKTYHQSNPNHLNLFQRKL